MSSEVRSFWRSGIDNNRIQGFVLGESESFIFLEYVCDFLKDGLLILRKNDISKSEITKTDSFQQPYIKSGIGKLPRNVLSFVADTWQEILTNVKNESLYISIEDENRSEIYMGRIISLEEESILISEFLGSGRWLEDHTTVYYEDITCAQLGNRYLLAYEEIFANR